MKSPAKQKRRAPDTIERNGMVYQLSTASIFERAMAEERQQADEMSYPRPSRPGAAPSPAQRALIDRIAACPFAIRWRGQLWRNNAYAEEIPCAPQINAVSINALWEKGYIMAGNAKGTVRLSTRGHQMCRPSRVAYERIRWEALMALSPQLCRDWEAYRELCRATKWNVPPEIKRPPLRVAAAAIRAEMRRIHKSKALGRCRTEVPSA